jgi:hypothetical protein
MYDLYDHLYHYLTAERLPSAPLPIGCAAQAGRKERAFQRLSDTFSPEQRQLYLQYEAEANSLADLEAFQLFRETLRLSRELFR